MQFFFFFCFFIGKIRHDGKTALKPFVDFTNFTPGKKFRAENAKVGFISTFAFPAEPVSLSRWRQNPGGTHISEWRTSATKHLRHRGLSVTRATKKIGGLSVTNQRLWGLSVIVTNQSLIKIIKMMGFEVTKSEIGGLWVTNQKLGVFEWQKIGGLWVAKHEPGGHWVRVGSKWVSFWWHMAHLIVLSASPGE